VTPELRHPGTPAIFLDRDGTMIHEVGYLSRLEDVRWFPSTLDVIRLFNRAGYLVCVITNQGGIGLELFDDAFVRGVHATMNSTIEQSGGRIDGWYYCPHHPRAVREALRTPCACRKPGRAMIDAACRDYGIDLTRSWVVGDRDVDILMAQAVGARGICVRTGHGARDVDELVVVPAGTLVVADLAEAAAEILAHR